MLSFVNDYSAGAHPKVFERLAETNAVKTVGYGEDEYCAAAKEKIREACACPDAQIYFLQGGTQTNQIAIDTMLEPGEGMLCAATGHINVHEAGAIEFCGHKVLALPTDNGKITAWQVRDYCARFYADESHEHEVFPGGVYITHATELGGVYKKEELAALRRVCDEYSLVLYLDGARLAYALGCGESDLTLADIARLTDAFYIGGTKCGALFGEALVFTKNNMPRRFITRVKQHGAMSAKGRLLGIQFDALFTDGLYWEIGRQTVAKADAIKKILREKGYEFFIDSPTNQIYIVVDNAKKAELAKSVVFSFWEYIDENRTAIRLVTDWATKDEDIAALERLL